MSCNGPNVTNVNRELRFVLTREDFRANVPSFYYDAKTEKCKDFVYGGCGGNENRFGSLAECEKTCS